MEEHIIKLSEKYLFPKSPDLVTETKNNLKEIRSGYGRLYWNFYNAHDECNMPTGCGTAFHSAHNSAYAKLLEQIILDIYKQIEKYKLSHKN